MTGSRKTIQMQNEIYKLKDSGQSERKISKILRISRNTVRGILKNRLSWASATEVLCESRVWSHCVPWDKLQSELSKPYVTIKQLAREYAPEGIDYLRFWRELNRRIPEDLMAKVQIRMKHQPAERFEIDYSEGLLLTDRRTGAQHKM